MSELGFHRAVAALLSVCLLLSSLGVLRADAAGPEDVSAAAVVAADATLVDASAAPPEQAEDDCVCLCACACLNAPCAALPTAPAPPPPSSTATFGLTPTTALAGGVSPAHWRPPLA